jgi:hypothetical protein
VGAVKTCPQQGVVVVEHRLRLGFLRGESLPVMRECGDVVLPFPMAGLEMEKLDVGVSILR